MAQVTTFSAEELAADAEANLGRANGNIYQRLPGVEGVHDGQVLIRLKKKRFAVLDYSIIPNEADLEAAKTHPNIKILNGAGTTVCKKPECNKVGIPVCVYDAEPDEPLPLYMRSGLCFLCQRNLNEERRTDRKRPPKESGNEPGILYAIGPTGKKLKISGNTIQLKDDAIIINGAVKGIRPWSADYGFREIAPELKDMVREATDNTTLLVDAAGGDNSESTEAEPGLSVAAINELYHKAFQSLHQSLFLLTQWKASYDTERTATASATAVTGKSEDPNDKMAPLLLAAGQEIDHQELMEQVQAQVDQQIQQAELAEQANQAKK